MYDLLVINWLRSNACWSEHGQNICDDDMEILPPETSLVTTNQVEKKKNASTYNTTPNLTIIITT
jgi:hypothetical protein